MTEKITNVHGQCRFVDHGRASGVQATAETFLDLGPVGSKGYLKVEVFVDPEFPEHVTITVQDFSIDRFAAELPRVRVVVEGTTWVDTPFHPGNV